MTSSLPLVEVFILSYNRPEYLLQAIDSVLGQTYPQLKIIISDNSSRDDVEQKIQSYTHKDKITYLRRRPTLPALAHFNTIFAEATSEYFMVFHDDDVMLPDAISKLVTAIIKNPALSAVGANAFVLEDDQFTKNIFDPMLTEDRTLASSEELADHYLDSSKGHVPFPSYLYRRSKIANLKMIFKEGQKHADVSFLLKACKQGPFLWLKSPVMYYRRHMLNDSVTLDVAAIFSLCRFLLKNTETAYTEINLYKMKNYILWAKQRRQNKSQPLTPWRDRILMRSAFVYLVRHPKILVRAILKRLAHRLHTHQQPPNSPK